ncbi:MAG: hypothetical protein Fur0022_02340 [Anaerolineales bacterium]
MSTNVTIQISEHLYRQLERVARISKRPVEEVLSLALVIALPPFPALSEVLASELAAMIWMSDRSLWAATQPTFSPDEQDRLAALNDLNDERTLTRQEETERTRLLAAYDRAVLRRAQAFAILSRRGHRIPSYADLANAE